MLYPKNTYFISKYLDLTSLIVRETKTTDDGPSGRHSAGNGVAVMEYDGCTIGIASRCKATRYAFF